MKRLFVAALLYAMVTLIHGPALSEGALAPRNIVVSYDRGGNLVDYARYVSSLQRQDVIVRIAGTCDSACTLFLSLPANKACVYPGATFGFHRAHGASQTANNWGTDYMMRSYPYWVRQWIYASGGLSSRIKRMDYRYAAQFVPTCRA